MYFGISVATLCRYLILILTCLSAFASDDETGTCEVALKSAKELKLVLRDTLGTPAANDNSVAPTQSKKINLTGKDFANPDAENSFVAALLSLGQAKSSERVKGYWAFSREYPMLMEIRMVLFSVRATHMRLNKKGFVERLFSWLPAGVDGPIYDSPFEGTTDLFILNFSAAGAMLHLKLHVKKGGQAVAVLKVGHDDGTGSIMSRGVDENVFNDMVRQDPVLLHLRDEYRGHVERNLYGWSMLSFTLESPEEINSFMKLMDARYRLSGDGAAL